MDQPATAAASAVGPVASEMRRRLDAALDPAMCELVDESALHHGHAGHDGRGESHFRLVIESAAFAGKTRVARQRLVYAALGELMNDRVHALSITARAPGEL
ncbi:MAG: BolA family protein [Sphingomicrobium sp.]